MFNTCNQIKFHSSETKKTEYWRTKLTLVIDNYLVGSSILTKGFLQNLSYNLSAYVCNV